METNNIPQPTQKIAEKIIHLCSFGLVKGLGEQKEGKMCIEAVVNFALGLPHSDNPPCIGEEIRKVKIALNDCDWSSNDARGKGMRKLAVAQLGSNELNQEEFLKLFRLKSTQKILPFLIQEHYNSLKEKDEKLLEYKNKFEQLQQFDDKLFREFINKYYDYDYDYYYYYIYIYYNYSDEFFLLIADCILLVLVELKSPGCQWLHLIKK